MSFSVCLSLVVFGFAQRVSMLACVPVSAVMYCLAARVAFLSLSAAIDVVDLVILFGSFLGSVSW